MADKSGNTVDAITEPAPGAAPRPDEYWHGSVHDELTRVRAQRDYWMQRALAAEARSK